MAESENCLAIFGHLLEKRRRQVNPFCKGFSQMHVGTSDFQMIAASNYSNNIFVLPFSYNYVVLFLDEIQSNSSSSNNLLNVNMPVRHPMESKYTFFKSKKHPLATCRENKTPELKSSNGHLCRWALCHATLAARRWCRWVESPPAGGSPCGSESEPRLQEADPAQKPLRSEASLAANSSTWRLEIDR